MTEEQKLELAFMIENGLMKTKEVSKEDLMKLYPGLEPVSKKEEK